MNWYLEALKKYAVFKGRARRKEYWYFILFNSIIIVALCGINVILGIADMFAARTGMGLLLFIYELAVLIPGVAVTVRRLHDTERSGWWLFICLIPFIGAIVLLIFMVQDSTLGTNKYGANPKEATA